ncbi:Smr/MutS family protein [Mycoplasma simbae]|uniref:Smr/MutS family protein n=1 Tax=Mycoplasma simbae TaxID=36744 RepID=UPI0006892BCF|nr:Smr/MutS family protein [Mycoplasma simbae]
MTYRIDLHGYNVEQAISRIILGMLNAQDQGYDNVLIITGNGTGAMKLTVEEYLTSENIDFEIIQEGNYLVWIEYEDEYY